MSTSWIWSALADHLVGHRLALPDAGDPLDLVVEGLEMLDVDGGDHVDAGGPQLRDVVGALGVPAARHVRVSQLVDERPPPAAGQHRIDVDLGRTARRDSSTSRRGTTSSPSSCATGRGRPWVSTKPTTTSVPRAEPPVRLAEHGVGLADPGRGAEVDGEPAARRTLLQCPAGHPPARGVRDREVQLNTLTRGSPRTPRVRPWVLPSTSHRTSSTRQAASRRDPGDLEHGVCQGDVAGRGRTPAVTASAGTSVGETPSSAAIAALRSVMAASSVGTLGAEVGTGRARVS